MTSKEKDEGKPVKGSFLDIMKAAAKDANKKSKKKEIEEDQSDLNSK